jgi:hypothetical protein
VHGCGWDSGAARERSSALAASVASRYALGADGVGAAAPGRPNRVAAGPLPRATRSARRRRGRCAPRRPHVLPRLRTLSSGGSGDVEDVVRCALLKRLGARRASSSSCRGRGWGDTPRGPCCHRLRHARAEHRYGGSWQEGGDAAAPRSRAARRRAGHAPPGGAPWEARARAARVQTAGEDLVVVVVVRTPTPNYLRQASPDRGKFTSGRRPLIGG